MSLRPSARIGCAVILLAATTLPAAGQRYPENLPADHEAVAYRRGPVDNPVERLARRLADGAASLEFRHDGLGYLRSLLDLLDINADSQALVFSKTGQQQRHTSPRTPRAIYFNDEVAVGFVRGATLIELAVLDPERGVVFYGLGAHPSPRPRLTARMSCLGCHHGPATLGVPGLYVGSVYPNPSGQPNFGLGTVVTDHRTPFDERWGGWYVSGTHGTQRHRGNAVARDPSTPDLLETDGTQNLTSLARKFDTSLHLTPVSDIVALMTLEHQTQMTNYLTRLGWQARISAAEGNDDVAGGPVGVLVEETVAYMLFANEAPLSGPIEGVSSFTTTFPARGPHDRRGRSLRDFDLGTRLFRYPLSYLIYSRGFDALPVRVRTRVYARLHEILTGHDRSAAFAHLSSDDRRAIAEIVRETKTGLPAAWGEQAQP